jgi:cytochrome c biogenesis protein CcmG, thiol:disulfide interchange protein DsbE
VDGGVPAFKAELRKLRGQPVVVNKWASWCGPCLEEFPFLRDQANKLRGKVAFLGVNSVDHDGNARKFLAKNRIPYESFRDPEAEIAGEIKAPQAYPATAFYDRKGEFVYVKQGQYSSETELAEDIERYAR